MTTLPFDRGDTYFGGDTDRATTTGTDQIVGREYVTPDEHNNTYSTATSREKCLVVLRNASSGSLTRGRGLSFGTASDDILREVSGYVGTEGAVGITIDDAYSTGTSIVTNDLFYGVLWGPNRINTSTVTTTASLAQHAEVAFEANGRLTAANAGDFVVGVTDVSTNTTNTNSELLVHIKPFLVAGR